MRHLADRIELDLRDAQLLLRLQHARCPRLLSLLACVLDTALALHRLVERRGELDQSSAQERALLVLHGGSARGLLELPLKLLGLPAQFEKLEGLIAPIISERRAQGMQVRFVSA
eukprot:jgi/Chrpa1/27889/Chrysochromulina_OHIO_Genome00008630-RA